MTAKAPLWQGEDISDKTLYTYYEAGFGDMIMFARKVYSRTSKTLQKICYEAAKGADTIIQR